MSYREAALRGHRQSDRAPNPSYRARLSPRPISSCRLAPRVVDDARSRGCYGDYRALDVRMLLGAKPGAEDHAISLDAMRGDVETAVRASLRLAHRLIPRATF